ncbi:MAG TPA: cytochrome c [Acetobacteraceae bacterium]|nr:cytochrome c [Acetobacteraceae bacterium]
MRKLLAGVICVSLGGFALAHAQGSAVSVPADAIIAARQATFDLQQAALISLKVAIDNKLPLGKAQRDAARAIAAWGTALPGMFPPGTDSGHHTHAKPQIWSDRATFEKAAAALATAAGNMAKAAEAGDSAAFAADFRTTAGACKSCHEKFRAR